VSAAPITISSSIVIVTVALTVIAVVSASTLLNIYVLQHQAQQPPKIDVVKAGNYTYIVNPGSKPVFIVAAVCHGRIVKIRTYVSPGEAIAVPYPDCVAVMRGGFVSHSSHGAAMILAARKIRVVGNESFCACPKIDVEERSTIACAIPQAAYVTITLSPQVPVAATIVALVNGTPASTVVLATEPTRVSIPVVREEQPGEENAVIALGVSALERNCFNETWTATIYAVVPVLRAWWLDSSATVVNVGTTNVTAWWGETTVVISPRTTTTVPAQTITWWQYVGNGTRITLTTARP